MGDVTIGGLVVDPFPIAQNRQRIEDYMRPEDGDDVFYNLLIRGTSLLEIFNEQEIEEHFANEDLGRYYVGCIIFSDYHIEFCGVGENDLTFISNTLYVYLSPCSSLKLCLQIAMYNNVIAMNHNVIVNLWHLLYPKPNVIPREATVRINTVRDDNIQLPDERARDIYVGQWGPDAERFIFKATIESNGEVELHADSETNSLYDLARELPCGNLPLIFGEWAARPTIATRAWPIWFESLRVAGLVTCAFPIMETRRLFDIHDLGIEFPDVMYFVIHEAAELDEFFPFGHEAHDNDSIADLFSQPTPWPRYCALVVFKNPNSDLQLEILDEEVLDEKRITFIVLDEDENTVIFLWPAKEAYPSMKTYFRFSIPHHKINVFHNYRNHDLPRLNLLTVSQPRREEQPIVLNNVEIEIARERETGHLMKFGMDGRITFPCLLDNGVGDFLEQLLGWIKFGRENPHKQPHQWESDWDVELRLPTITF